MTKMSFSLKILCLLTTFLYNCKQVLLSPLTLCKNEAENFYIFSLKIPTFKCRPPLVANDRFWDVLTAKKDANWSTFGSKFKTSAFNNLLNSYSVTNQELKVKRKKEPGLAGSVAAIEKLKAKMAIKRNYNFFANLLIAGALASIVYMCYTDIETNGSWQASRTHEGLRRIGVLKYTKKLQEGFSASSEWLHVRIEEQFPGYYEKAADYVQPYVQLTHEVGLVACNIFGNVREAAVKTYPSVRASIESYAPGLIEGSQQFVINTWSASKYYFHQSIEYLKTEVFVGKLAPENIQKVVCETYDVVQQKVASYYYWAIDKIQLAIK